VSLRVFAAVADGRAVLDPEETHYLRRVRRAADGAAVEVIDPDGGLWRATVAGGDARRTELQVDAAVATPEGRRELQLLLGLPDPAAALELLPGVVELGVAELVWVRCARSQSGPPGDARLARVLRASQRQCGRPRPPALRGPLALADALALRPDLPGWFAWEQRRGAADEVAPPAGARLLVGPEGGLAGEEIHVLERAGLSPLALGPFTLRTPTAALVGLARLMFAAR
jgi:16S rRNA (uracil1498-N3)-methyltransferase